MAIAMIELPLVAKQSEDQNGVKILTLDSNLHQKHHYTLIAAPNIVKRNRRDEYQPLIDLLLLWWFS